MSSRKNKSKGGQALNPVNTNTKKDDLSDQHKINVELASGFQNLGENVATLFESLPKIQCSIEKLQRAHVIMRMDHTKLVEANTETKNQLIHVNNECLHLKNVSRLSTVIFSGVSTSPTSSAADVKKELEEIMKLLRVSDFHLAHYSHLPWGEGFALKCTFAQATTCGKILRNSYIFISEKAKFRVRPDLSHAQRAVRSKLLNHGKKLKEETGATYILRSWRFLQVTHGDGSVKFYEADVSSRPVLIDPSIVPDHFKKPSLRSSSSPDYKKADNSTTLSTRPSASTITSRITSRPVPIKAETNLPIGTNESRFPCRRT